MSTLFFAELMPWLILMLLLQKKIQKNQFFTSPIILFFLVGTIVAGLLLLRVAGLPLISWCTTLMSNVSLPFVGLLIILLVEQLFSCTIFLPHDWKAAWIFGAVSSLIVYPAALGLSHIDPYAWGWGTGKFFLVMAGLAFLLLLTRNRFGILLLLALAAFDFQLQESTNLWDYLLDPIYGLVALVISLCYFFRGRPKPVLHLFVP